MTELTLQRHTYPTAHLGEDFYVAGYFVQANHLRLGPFKTDQEAFNYASVFKQIEPEAEIHLFELLGLTALKEDPHGK